MIIIELEWMKSTITSSLWHVMNFSASHVYSSNYISIMKDVDKKNGHKNRMKRKMYTRVADKSNGAHVYLLLTIDAHIC